MKKTELEKLLRIITEEVVKIQAESKGLSGMKKSPISTDHTEKVADSKDLTGPAPKEKEEGKKLPVVKKPATPKKVGSIKEQILQMIREEIDEMARTAGAVAPEYRKEIEPGKWVIMGHPNQDKYPDGTPTTQPKGPYVKRGKNVDTVGLPSKTATGPSKKPISAKETELAVADIIKYKPNATDEEIAAELTTRSENGEPLNLAPSIIAHAIDMAKSDIENIGSDGDDVSSFDDEPTTKRADSAAADEEAKIDAAIAKAKAKGAPKSANLKGQRDAFARYRSENPPKKR